MKAIHPATVIPIESEKATLVMKIRPRIPNQTNRINKKPMNLNNSNPINKQKNPFTGLTTLSPTRTTNLQEIHQCQLVPINKQLNPRSKILSPIKATKA